MVQKSECGTSDTWWGSEGGALSLSCCLKLAFASWLMARPCCSHSLLCKTRPLPQTVLGLMCWDAVSLVTQSATSGHVFLGACYELGAFFSSGCHCSWTLLAHFNQALMLACAFGSCARKCRVCCLYHLFTICCWKSRRWRTSGGKKRKHCHFWWVQNSSMWFGTIRPML